jgi:hypothetical protein
VVMSDVERSFDSFSSFSSSSSLSFYTNVVFASKIDFEIASLHFQANLHKHDRTKPYETEEGQDMYDAHLDLLPVCVCVCA